MFESALGGGAYAAGLLDRALARVALLDRFGTSEVGAQLRLMFRRVRRSDIHWLGGGAGSKRGSPRALPTAISRR
jgi:sugar/nucleoside kinase (ribokinase family)